MEMMIVKAVSAHLAANAKRKSSLKRAHTVITVIDTDAERLRELGDRLDIGTVHGMGCYPAVLKDAGAEDAEGREHEPQYQPHAAARHADARAQRH